QRPLVISLARNRIGSRRRTGICRDPPAVEPRARTVIAQCPGRSCPAVVAGGRMSVPPVSPTVARGLAVVAALANVLGAVAVVSRARWSERALNSMIAFSAGFMVAVAVVEMIPAAIVRHGAGTGWIVLGGYLLVHFAQHTIAPHFHFGAET